MLKPTPSPAGGTPSRCGWLQSAHLALPLLFVVVMYLFFPYRERFQFNPDEGGEAMKAMLVVRGYPLYDQVWSDQPPVLTFLLAACLRIFGPDVNAGRTLILLLSAALMAAAVQFLRSNWGGWHALAGAVLLFLLPFYTTLSVSIMRGLPAISFAMLSLLALSAWHQHRRTLWLVLSALALALSVHTKLFTFFLAPIFAVGLVLDEWARHGHLMHNWWSRCSLLRPALLWSLWFSGVVLAILLILVGPANIGQLINPHLDARQLSSYISQANEYPIYVRLLDVWPILALAGVGLVWILLERRWVSLYLLAWVVGAYALLSFFAPLRYHHKLLVSVPAALMAAIAAGEVIHLLSRIRHWRSLLSRRSVLGMLAVTGVITTLVVRLPTTLPEFYRSPVLSFHPPHSPWGEQSILIRMANRAHKTQWVVTDLPMYAFRVGLLVPPNLSFISEKRLYTGEITEKQIIQDIEVYRPEMVLLGRSRYPVVKDYLKADYRLLFERESRLFIRNDLKDQN